MKLKSISEDYGTIQYEADGSWQKGKGVNSPQLLTGMTPVKFTEPTDSEEGKTVKTTSSDSEWYNYNTKKWANAQTQDGSMWVWIPRYIYGDAIRKTSTAGINNTSWYNDISLFPRYTHVFFRRGGAFWDNLKSSIINIL